MARLRQERQRSVQPANFGLHKPIDRWQPVKKRSELDSQAEVSEGSWPAETFAGQDARRGLLHIRQLVRKLSKAEQLLEFTLG